MTVLDKIYEAYLAGELMRKKQRPTEHHVRSSF